MRAEQQHRDEDREDADLSQRFTEEEAAQGLHHADQQTAQQRAENEEAGGEGIFFGPGGFTLPRKAKVGADGSFVVKGLVFSVQLTLVAMIGGIAIGTLLALMRLSGRKPLVLVAAFYVNTMRSIPLVTRVTLSRSRASRMQ